MIAFDHLTLDARKTTKEGFLAVRARAARTGLYDYAGSEVDPDNAHGLRDKAVVKVYRSGDQVFDRASIASFIGKPITNDHPATAVTADNWREHARGTVMGAVRDGEYVSFDLMLTDAAAIAAVKSGKRELSNGYQTTLDFTPGTTPEGHAYDVKQTAIVGNHIALVDRGRAGPECRIADAIAVCDANPAAVAALQEGNAVKKITLDGLQVDLSDADAVSAAIAKLQDKASTAEAALADANAKLSTAAGERAALEKQLADANTKLEPASLDKLVADRAALIVKAKAVKADIVTDGKTDADIRKEVVTAKLGDAAAGMDDAAISGAFAVLSADVKKATPEIHNLPSVTATDAQSAEAKAFADSVANLNAWRKAKA
ncbi:hypothetical protein C7451_106136 [Blastomonas natatoria]|uniref:DUF2213 domain-containing protein n=1 Tax=Blastomonas natatoria TaxID=34015 RepID=A0A2V3V2H3_9SPHN|nr:DUF2213 domain-containing protein [Blastomonas natatoria]PXW75972.1 hypothetical protein C7451_106136 [Blastomonas natatoria]